MEKKDIIIIILIIIIIWYNKNNFMNLINIINFFFKNNIYKNEFKNDEKDLIKTSKLLKYINNKLDNNVNNNIKNENILEIAKYSFSGGKKIRPMIFIVVYNMLNNNQCDTKLVNENIINCALFIEYIHTGSLILDDIMDKDNYRRGKESVYIKLSKKNLL
jgi:geranylgeranyl pyrophosphate synthase